MAGLIRIREKNYLSFFNPGRRWTDVPGQYEYWCFSSVTYRITDKLSFYYEWDYFNQLKQKGWVRTSDNKDIINFGIRNVRTITNTINSKYIFNISSYLSFRLRHYNQNVVYSSQYYELNNDGTLRKSSYTDNHNKCYNIFNIDMVYAWRFAPGSELSVVWKNIIETDVKIIRTPYSDNFKNTIDSPQTNSFSIKIIYYLDYLYLKKS